MSRFRRARLCALLALTMTAVACDGSSGPEVTPSVTTVAGGNGQTAVVGQLVGQALAVLVTGTDGEPFEGATVEWAVTAGGGSVAPPQSTTGPDGLATTSWTLGTSAGQQSARATVQGLPSVLFAATAEPGAPAEVAVSPAAPAIDALEASVSLEAELRDDFGNAIADAAFEWSSDDEAVATVVAATGEVTGHAVGSADITATETGSALDASVTVEVRQLPASVEITPAGGEVPVGATLQLSATVSDENGHEAPGASVDWSSGDDAVASVDGNGLVTGQAEGNATVTAASGEVSADVEVNVILVPADFEPTEDQTISGTMTVGTLTVPAGVTLTATADTEIRAFGDVTIDGTITGDCVGLSVIGDQNVTLTGLIENDCSAAAPGDPPDLLVQGAGAINAVGAEFGSSGATTVTNVPPAMVAAVGRAGDSRSAVSALASLERVAEGVDCSFSDVLIRQTDQADGAAGSPRGDDGATGEPQTLACAGTARFEGANTGVFGHDGGDGGRGDSSESGVVAVGGHGGAGADAIVMAGGDVVIADAFLIVEGGNGGFGGPGVAEAYPVAEGNGGDAGPPGLGRVVVGGELRTEGSGQLAIEVGGAASGGDGVATGLDGTDATSTTPAEPGGDAMARGGNGSDWGGEEGVNLVGDMIQGAIAVGANIEPRAVLLFAPAGGSAGTTGGEGGSGSFDFPDGVRGGHQTAVGGEGGDVNVFDNRGAPVPLANAEAGRGGNIFFQGARGGNGASRCMVFPVMSGGKGGDGGDLAGATGEGGADGSGGTAAPGDATYNTTSNGGGGGSGNAPGAGGTAGDDSFVVVSGMLAVVEPSLMPGGSGGPCVTGFDVTVAVQSDPNGHEPFIMMTTVTMLDALIGEDGTITITSGSSIWIPVTGTVAGGGTFAATGVGTAAGFPDVSVSFEGTVESDSEGNITGLTGTLTVDSTNSVLPADGEGVRNPAVYTVTGTKKGGE